MRTRFLLPVLLLNITVPAHAQAFGLAQLHQRDGCPSYTVVDSVDLDLDNLRLPRASREMAFVAALEKILKQDGTAPWPVLVLSAPDRREHSPEVPTLATTRRILLRDVSSTFRPAAAIVLNSVYWGDADPSRADNRWADSGLATMVARHELYHVARAWSRGPEAAAHANAIEERVAGVGSPPIYRKGLESLVRQSLTAREEIEAIDRSLASAVLLPAHRQGILRYREESRLREVQVVKNLMDLFPSVRDAAARQEIQRWLADLLHRDLGAPADLPDPQIVDALKGCAASAADQGMAISAHQRIGNR
jgi:hypothetical protein